MSKKRLCEILVELKEYLSKNDFPFYLVSVTITNADDKNDDVLKIENFPADLIGSENMENEMERYFS